MVQSELAEGRLASLFEDYQVVLEQEPSYAWLVHPSRHYVPTKTRKAIDFLIETFARDGYTDKKPA
jgi:DNA-binding transcriptional LysR family regulator